MKLLKNKDTSVIRLLLRRDKTGKIATNHQARRLGLLASGTGAARLSSWPKTRVQARVTATDGCLARARRVLVHPSLRTCARACLPAGYAGVHAQAEHQGRQGA